MALLAAVEATSLKPKTLASSFLLWCNHREGGSHQNTSLSGSCPWRLRPAQARSRCGFHLIIG
jgi:hypothetical protein